MKYAFFALFALSSPAFAEMHEVKMLNRNETGPMVYEPSYLQIAPGDTVRFLPSQPGHNAATIDEMLPEGAEAFKSKINAEYEARFDVAGRYGIKCSPHYAMGMVMVIDVGDSAATTTPAAPLPEGLPKRAEDRLRAILGAVR